MVEDIAAIIATAEDHMKKAIGHLEAELVKIRAGSRLLRFSDAYQPGS